MYKGRRQISCSIGYRLLLMEWRPKILIPDVYSMSDRSALLGYYYVNFRWPSAQHINAYSCEMCRQSADFVRLWCFVQSVRFVPRTVFIFWAILKLQVYLNVGIPKTSLSQTFLLADPYRLRKISRILTSLNLSIECMDDRYPKAKIYISELRIHTSSIRNNALRD